MRASTLLLTVLLACRDDAADAVAEHDHDVDADEPVDCDAAIVPLLELEGRTIGDVRRAGELTIVMSTWRPAGEPATANTTRITTVDGCGHAARTLVDGLSAVHPAPRADLPWLVTDADERSWLVDPLGGRPPHRLASSRVELAAWAQRGPVVATDPADGDLRVLVQLAMDADGRVHERTLLVDVPDGAFAVAPIVTSSITLATNAGDVVVVDFETGAIDTLGEIDEIRALDREGRSFVVSRDHARGRDLRVHDRITATNIALGRPEWADVSWQPLPGAVEAVQGPTSDAPEETQLVLVPEMREVWWPAAGLYDTALRGSDGARLFVQDEVVLWLAPDAVAPEALELGLVPGTTERIELFAFDDELVIAVRGRQDQLGVILTRWFRPAASGEAVEELFEHPVWGAFRVDADRWTYFDGATDNRDWRGDLLLRRGSTGARWPLRTNVRNQLFMLNERIDLPLRYATRDEFVFVEADDDGVHSTLWLARPDLLE